MKLQRKQSYLALVPALALALATGVHAAGDADKRSANTTHPTVATTTKASVQEMRASDLIGKNVTNRSGEGLGEIKDLVVDTTNGRVQYAVISMGGFLGMGDKLYAYPLERFERTSERGRSNIRSGSGAL